MAFLSFLIGFIFMVLLRFLIRPCVWLLGSDVLKFLTVSQLHKPRFAVFLVLLKLCVGGGLCWVRSKQCAGKTCLLQYVAILC